MGFGIIQRYVLGEVVRAFLMALLTMTIIFVLFMVMAEAAKLGLSPSDIAMLVPYVIPSTLPFTVPVSMLFAVTVVFGRLASDNEIIAIKTAGLDTLTVLWPAYLLGGFLSVTLFYLSREHIPNATHEAKMVIYKNLEEMFYKLLKKEREFNNAGWPFLIKVADVDLESRWMVNAIFKQRRRGDPNSFGMVTQAKRARIRFDMQKMIAYVTLEGAEVSPGGDHDDVALLPNQPLEFSIPEANRSPYEKRLQEFTTPELNKEQADNRRLMATERKRRAIETAFSFASGRLGAIDWSKIDKAIVDYDHWTHKVREFETEKRFREAQSVGPLVFVLLGAPVGILFARRDFLSAFIVCFMPIIGLYYPLMLLGINLGKEGVVDPTAALWTGNALLVALFGVVIRPVRKH